MIDEKRFPHAARFLREHPDLDLDSAIAYLEKQISS